MVRRLAPSAYVLVHNMRFGFVFKVGGHPHMVQPTSAVGRLPILRAVTPPGVELLRRINKMASDIDPVTGILDRGEMFAFNISYG